MKDIQIISITDGIRIVLSKKDSPSQLRLICEGGLNNLSTVYINNFRVATYTVLSDRQMVITIPEKLQELQESDLNVALRSSVLTDTTSAALDFEITNRLRDISGIQKLVQQIIKTMLSFSGSNRFDPSEGGGLLSMLSRADLSEGGKSKIAAIVMQTVDDTAAFFLNAQAQSNLPASERLLSLQLNGLEFIPEQTEVKASIKVVSFAGESFDLPISL